jgi:hypothetical protein
MDVFLFNLSVQKAMKLTLHELPVFLPQDLVYHSLSFYLRSLCALLCLEVT